MVQPSSSFRNATRISDTQLSFRDNPAKKKAALPSSAPKDPRKALVERYKNPRKKPSSSDRRMHGHFSPWQALLGLLFVVAILAPTLYSRFFDTGHVSDFHYNIIRITLFVSVWLLIVVSACQHNMLHGSLCLFFPPYILFYALFPLDSSPLKGMTLGLLLFLGADFFLMGNKSTLATSQVSMERFLESGNSWIDKTASGRDFIH